MDFIVHYTSIDNVVEGDHVRAVPADIAWALHTFPHAPLPIVLDERNHIVCGSDLLAQARRIGLRAVPVLYVDEIRSAACAPDDLLSVEECRQLHLKARDVCVDELMAPFRVCYTPASIKRSAETIKKIGFYFPLLASAGAVIHGDNYLLAARALGMPTVPVVQLKELSANEREFFVKVMERRVAEITRSLA